MSKKQLEAATAPVPRRRCARRSARRPEAIYLTQGFVYRNPCETRPLPGAGLLTPVMPTTVIIQAHPCELEGAEDARAVSRKRWRPWRRRCAVQRGLLIRSGRQGAVRLVPLHHVETLMPKYGIRSTTVNRCGHPVA